MTSRERGCLRRRVISALKEVYDPELPVDVYELGLIYEIDIDEEKNRVGILMTLTTPSCPVADSLPEEVRRRVQEEVDGQEVTVRLTFDPPYDPSRLSEAAKLALGML